MLIADILKLPVVHRSDVPNSLLDDIAEYQRRNEAAELSDLSYEVLASSDPDPSGNWSRDVFVLRLRGEPILMGFRSGKYGDDWSTHVLDPDGYREVFDRLRHVPQIEKAQEDIRLDWPDLLLLHEAGVVDSRDPGPVQDLNHLKERLYLLAVVQGYEILLTERDTYLEAFPRAVVLQLVRGLTDVSISAVCPPDHPDHVYLRLEPSAAPPG